MSLSINDMDLNISNYKLDDILHLFNLSYNFDDNDLKRAYKQTLMTHPDKSGLEKEYFLFFSKAFKKVKYIYDYRKKHNDTANCPKSTIYQQHLEKNIQQCDVNIQKEIKEKLVNSNDFNKKFNALFEHVKIRDDEHDSGYEEWMKQNEVAEENTSIHNVRSLNEYIEQKKEYVKSIVEYKGVQELNSSDSIGATTNLKRTKPTYYESGLFSKMQYEDYKRAHSETVVPVTYDDYLNRKHFNNVNELQQHRTSNESIPSLEQSRRLMGEMKNKEYEESITIAYDLTRQMEDIERSNEKWNSHFKLLMNDNQ